MDYLNKTLGIGKVYVSGDNCTFIVSKLEEIQAIVDLLSNRPLNSTKYLNFLDFKKAFILYTNRDNLAGKLIAQIIELKNNMNYNRVDHNMVMNREIIVTKS